MNTRRRDFVTLVIGLSVFGILVWLTAVTLENRPFPAILLPGILFCVLMVFTMTFGVSLGGGVASLLPMIIVASYLVIGVLPTAWALWAAVFVHGYIRHRWSRQMEQPMEGDLLAQVSLTVANAAIQPVCILTAGAVYRLAGGVTPLFELRWEDVLPLMWLGLTSYGVNLLLVGVYFAFSRRAKLKLYFASLRKLIFYELLPLPFAPLTALVYNRLGLALFLLLALAIVLASLIVRDLSRTTQRLERRVKEMIGLQAVGQALSVSLELETILLAIYKQVSALMPVQVFYVALYEPEGEQISFPWVIEQGARAHWPARRAENGLTEYLLRTRTPLLIQGDSNLARQSLGVRTMPRPSLSFLGVPLLAGAQPLGVIGVQSYTESGLYDASHQEVLGTIAAQAAMAIQNARLYARTDAALARRVQELDSVMTTIQEGILLVDLNYRVVAANQALADLIALPLAEVTQIPLISVERNAPFILITLLGDNLAEFQIDCQMLLKGTSEFRKRVFTLPEPPERFIERTLTLVRNRQGSVTGWLLVFHDLTEQHKLEQLREEMTFMLIHDLRSPLSTLQGHLCLIEEEAQSGNLTGIEQHLTSAQRSGERVLRLINLLLDIGRFEGGQMPLQRRSVAIDDLLSEAAAPFALIAEQSRITMEVVVEAALFPISVDPEHFGRVLNNLIDNAFKFTPDGGHISVWARRDNGASSAAVLVGVSDSGPGISPDARPRLFQKFKPSASPKGQRGTGLGLVYCKLAVEAHGGSIWVESEPGRGSTFIIRLPIL